jgi:hypothetical protein
VKLQLAGGMEVDILGGDEYTQGVDKICSMFHTRKDRSNRPSLYASGVMPSSGPLLLNFGMPPVGTLWVPLWLVVTGPDDRTQVTSSSVATYLGGQAPSAATLTANPPPLANLLIPGTAETILPYYRKISGRDAVYANATDGIYCLVYGAASGTNITATLRVREVHPADSEQVTII